MKYDLTVSRADLLKALANVKKGIRRPSGTELLFYMENGSLVFSLMGSEYLINAKGTWPGTVRINSRIMMPILKVPPHQDPVRLHVEDGRLHIGTLSCPCSQD